MPAYPGTEIGEADGLQLYPEPHQEATALAAPAPPARSQALANAKRRLFGSSPQQGFANGLMAGAAVCLGLSLFTVNPVLAAVGIGLALTAAAMMVFGAGAYGHAPRPAAAAADGGEGKGQLGAAGAAGVASPAPAAQATQAIDDGLSDLPSASPPPAELQADLEAALKKREQQVLAEQQQQQRLARPQ